MSAASTYITLQNWLTLHPVLAGALLLWSLAWKGFALWKAAELQQKYWFIAILVVNSFGILEIIYLFFVANQYEVEVIDQTV